MFSAAALRVAPAARKLDGLSAAAMFETLADKSEQSLTKTKLARLHGDNE